MRAGLVLSIVFATAASAAVRASACEIPGLAERWALANCFHDHETDDELHPGVVECFDKWQASRSDDDCAEKHVLKAKACEKHLRWSQERDSVEECIADPSFVPGVVEHGVGG